MKYSLLGILGYLLFFAYDYNEVKKIGRYLKMFFAIGMVLQISATIGMVIENLENTDNLILGGTISVIGLSMLIYSLFLAIPFKDTYIDEHQYTKVKDDGIYALSRHPGVLFYAIFYLGLAILQPSAITIVTYLIWTVMNIIYVAIQDIWVFPKTLYAYDMYKDNTPFLLPNIKSLRKFIKSI